MIVMKMKLPRGERSKVGYCTSNGELLFIMTQKDSGGFTLYKVSGENIIKLGRGTDPKKLESSFNVMSEIRK